MYTYFLLFLMATASISCAENNDQHIIVDTEQCINEQQQCKEAHIAVFDFNHKTDFRKLILDLMKVAKDPKIDGILFLVDHNGGEMARLSVVHDTLLKIKNIKPLVMLIVNAHSAGYLVASTAHYILAHSHSAVGSIGVYTAVDRYQNTKIVNSDITADLTTDLFIEGEYKAISSQFRGPLSEGQKAYFKQKVREEYEHFVVEVARNRSLDSSNSTEWAEGKWFLAEEAKRIGLIDEVGTIFEAEKKLKELVHVKDQTVQWSDHIEFVFMDDDQKK